MGILIRRYLRELCFAAFALVALALSGGAVVEGLPLMLAALTPGMAAQAQDTPRVPMLRLSLPGFTMSRHAPQLLYPVTAHPFPAWMTPRRPETPVIALCIDDLGEDI